MFITNTQISYTKTVLGWYNVTVMGLFVYNVEPEFFRRLTGVSEDAALGCLEISTEQLKELEENAIHIGLADGWEVVPSDGRSEGA